MTRSTPGTTPGNNAGEHGWLEDVDGDDALAWVRERNAESEAALFQDPAFEELRTEILEVLEAEDRIPMPMMVGEVVYNFWTDAEHRRGILRRASWEDYRTGSENWETVLDVDALGAAESESWVFHGFQVRRSDRRRALIELSPGGSDASVTREFDLVDKRFVDEHEGGFVRPLAKGSCTWIDDDTVYVMTDFGPGSMTRSGYPRTVRRWSRGSDMDTATVVFEGDEGDISVSVSVGRVEGYTHHVFRRGLDFYTGEYWILRDGTLTRIDVPVDVDVMAHERWFAFLPRKDWSDDRPIGAAGSLLTATIDGFLAGGERPRPVFTPTGRRALENVGWTRNHLVVTVLDDVRTQVEVATPPADGAGDWEVTALAGLPDVWTLHVGPVDSADSDDLWLTGNDFLTPATLYRITVGGAADRLRQSPHRFVTDGMAITQHFATSADGTRIPYFEVASTVGAGPRPTLLGGYGGFEVSNVAAYSGIIGRAWLAAGNTFVLANIRGGGEYGPGWHQAGLREHRHRVYEDFEAVARDLIERGMTTADQLGCSGGSNGGLLVGNMYVRTPELWGAIVCQVPLLDMQRYHLLLAGASWMAEYGDPDDPDDWAHLRTYSPYHLVDPDREHPPILLTTSTRDDRVHPGHARKMAARLLELGKDVSYWENIEGGHGGAADATQQATMQALRFCFLTRQLSG